MKIGSPLLEQHMLEVEWVRRDIEDSSFILPDGLAMLEYNKGICDNVNISLSLSVQLCMQQHIV